jgi:ribosome-binding factor A
MRRQIGSRLRLRRVPELEFRFDRSVEHQDRVERIIRDLHEHPPEPLDATRAEPLIPDDEK